MGLKSVAIGLFASKVHRSMTKWRNTQLEDQDRIMKMLIRSAQNTVFGKEHGFDKIKDYNDYKQGIPTRDYEQLIPYVNRIIDGEDNVLWPGKPKYFAKTSGTTSGVKYIPITKDSLPNHINTARIALMNYIHLSGNSSIFEGKVIFLSGSPELEYKGGIATGRLSGIVNHEIPFWVKWSQLPSWKTNVIEDWEEKLENIIQETLHQDMRLISGIPPWVQMYYERLIEITGKSNVKQIFPNFSLFMYGGVNFEPYRHKLEALTGGKIDSIETFPASEGFIAFQDQLDSPDLLLNTNSGLFFEFIPLDEFGRENAKRIRLHDVELGVDYALIINNNAGLWGYEIGDCVRFVSVSPYRLVVTGRVKHFISAFGEHVIGKEVEEAMKKTMASIQFSIVEFTVAPQINPPDGSAPYHEWFIEFTEVDPSEISKIAAELDRQMVMQNIYYADLIEGKILRPLVIRSLKSNAFRDYMKSQGKLGGQNKVPRLSNDRKIADALMVYLKDY